MTDIKAVSSGNCDLHGLITVFYTKVKTFRESSSYVMGESFLARNVDANASLSSPDVIS